MENIGVAVGIVIDTQDENNDTRISMADDGTGGGTGGGHARRNARKQPRNRAPRLAFTVCYPRPSFPFIRHTS